MCRERVEFPATVSIGWVFQDVPVLIMALAIMISRRAIVIMTSLSGFPRSLRRFATRLRAGLYQAAASAAWYSTCLRDRRPPAIVLLPRIAPLSCGAGAKPVMAAASTVRDGEERRDQPAI